MEYSAIILDKINVPTDSFEVKTIQELLLPLTKQNKLNNDKDFWNNVTEKLWSHLTEGLEQTDDQLLCATCFYSMLMLTEKQDQYLDKLLNIVYYVPRSTSIYKHKFVWKDLPHSGESNTNSIMKEYSITILQVVSFMYGMFQSSFLTQKLYHNIPNLVNVLKEMFSLLVMMGYEYTQYTFLVFKTLKSFKKLCGGPLEKHIFNKENQIKLLHLVNNNWENPITGVRDLNRSIFQTVLSTLNDETYKNVLSEVNGFYWNKAKYLMLTEIIEHSNGNASSLIQKEWVDGLVYSLTKPGLVSAGADMYYAILKKVNTQNDWCQLYLRDIINILGNQDSKPIENFNNYWCLTTLKKFGGTANILIDELENFTNSEELLYSKLCIMKQANKLGIMAKDMTKDGNKVQKAVLTGIINCNNDVRRYAFDILCVCQGKCLPSPMEYDLILEYLYNNVNSDNTVLRLSMFSSFNIFLSHLHSIFINVIIKNKKDDAMDNLLTFCERLQYFIINNFNIKGNYQRKITNVILCNSILTYFSEIPRKKKDQTRNCNIILKEFLKERAVWMFSREDFITKLISLLSDPAEDVRENTTNILISHYSKELQNVTLLQLIINNAMKNIRSKFFYDISCSQSMFKLIANLLLKQNTSIDVEYRTVTDIFDFAFNELLSQHKAPINVMDSIESGKQLHAYMNILLVVLEQCINNSYKIEINDKMPELLSALNNISNQFAWEEEGCSDFSKINDLVQNIIEASDYHVNQYEQTEISGMQQIVLNCMWLNVKASCDLASILLQYNNNSIVFCEQCLCIITRVLETSRHKGAIEAAGAALGKAIRYLTAIPNVTKRHDDKIAHRLTEENSVCLLPSVLLKRKLSEWISETNKMSSTTRRGAGLSIMVHRIVSNDMQKGKPLFHSFMKTLLEICNTKESAEDCQSNNIDEAMANKVDLPKAIYIHFLTRIVTDSSLATDMMYYAVELAALAFDHLTSPHWQIRNAALQLYGAFVPRLIGQKKASGTDDETIATVACDEMRTHLPKLWTYIIQQLEQCCDKDDIQAHSNLVPILNILANSAKRYPIRLFSKEEPEFVKLFTPLITLLNSRIHTVRCLTARAIFNLYEFEDISDSILKQTNITENQLHGILLLLKLCYKNYHFYSKHECSFKKLKIRFLMIFNMRICSYINRHLFEDIFGNDIDMKCLENTLLEMKSNVMPGVQVWADARLNKYIKECSWNNIPNLLRLLLQQSDYEKYCEYILVKIKAQHYIPNDVLLQVTDILITFEQRFDSYIIWNIIYETSLKTNLCIKAEHVSDILNRECSYSLRYALPIMARIISNLSSEEKSTLIEIIDNFSSFESSDVDMRYIAAIANNELANRFIDLSDDLKVNSIKCTILLLQDEDDDIRNLIAKFYSILCQERNVYQPYVCLNKVLDKEFFYTVFADPQKAIQDVCRKLTGVIFNSCHEKDKYNPFANDSRNIYLEPDLLKQLIDKLNT